jgi:hypothetical protein
MNVLGVVIVDLKSNGLGLSSLTAEPFGSTTVLGQTLSRISRCRSVDRWLLLVPDQQLPCVRALVGEEWPLEGMAAPPPRWQSFVRRARKWSLSGWRGGLARTSVLDEESAPREFTRLLAKYNAAWLVQVRAESPLVDPQLIDGLIDRTSRAQPTPAIGYGPIPPGLSGWLLRRDFVAELAEKELFPGYAVGYQPWNPTIELSEHPTAYRPPLAVSKIPCRLLVDNRHSLALARRFASNPQVNAVSICEALAANAQWLVPEAPAELEIEITTRRSLGVGPAGIARPDLDPNVFDHLLRQYASATDISLVTIGGHGDPLESPCWPDLLTLADEAGVYGMAMVTDGLRLDEATVDRLLSSSLDVLHVRLGGNSPASYRAVFGEDRFHDVRVNLNRFLDRRRAMGQANPLLVVSMVRCRRTLSETLDFYDEWSERAEGALIVGRSDYAGQLPLDDDVLSVEPPRRAACRRMMNRLVIHSDGTAVACGEDFGARQPLGRCPDQTLAELWTGPEATRMREAHWQGRWDDFPLCKTCHEWFRP